MSTDTQAPLAQTFGDGPVTPYAEPPRELGWGRFTLQFVTVAIAYFVPQAVLPLFFIELPEPGEEVVLSNTAVLVSVCSGALFGCLVAWLWLRSDRALGRAWNFTMPDGPGRSVAYGVAGAVAIAAIFVGGSALLNLLGFDMPDVDLIMDFVSESPLSLILWIVLVACLAAGLGEELIYRGFLFDRLLHVKGLAGKVWPAAIVQAVLFGLPHGYQGWGGVVLTGIVGLFFAWMRIRAKWSLWPLVIAHAPYDTVALTAGYGENAGWWSLGV